VRALRSGQSVVSFSVATTARSEIVTASPKNAPNGIAWWRSEGSRIIASSLLSKGSKGCQVYIEGHLSTRQCQDKDGTGTRYRTEIVAQQLRLLGSQTNGTVAPQAEASDETPLALLRVDILRPWVKMAQLVRVDYQVNICDYAVAVIER
jgi:single-stranded DNA-binding protein